MESAGATAVMTALGVVTVTDKASGKLLYQIRPGAETSVTLATLHGRDILAKLSARSIQVVGLTLASGPYAGQTAGVVVHANGTVKIGAPLPDLVRDWLNRPYSR